jgi:hypothetical protein
VARVTDTSKRIAAVYECLLPGLEQRFRRYVEQVDTLLDGPTVRILERILGDTARMAAEYRALLQEVPAVKLKDHEWLGALRQRDAALRDIVVPRVSSPAAVPA